MKRLFSHMAEVFAGFSEYTDVQIGRVIDYLEDSGQLENTLISTAPTMAHRERAVRMGR